MFNTFVLAAKSFYLQVEGRTHQYLSDKIFPYSLADTDT